MDALTPSRPSTDRTAACRRAALAALMLAVLAGPAAGPARAQAPDRVGISDLAMYVEGGDEPVSSVPSGTEAVEARFDYVEATGHEIGVLMKGRGGITLFGTVSELSGDGRATVTIEGAPMFGHLAGIVDAAARDAKRNAKQASSQSVGTQEFLLSVQAGILRAGYALDTLGAIEGLPADAGAKLSTADEQLERALRRAERAIALPADDVAGKQREAEAIDAMLGPIVQTAGELIAGAGAIPRLPLPTTGSGAQDAFVVQITVDGDVAATAELWVTDTPTIFLPYAVR